MIDHMAEALPWTPTDPLGEVLHLLRMRGAFYSRTELSEPWALEMPAFADTVSFHLVTKGSCDLDVAGNDTVELRAGDLALVPHGKGHLLSSGPDAGPPGRVDLLPQRHISEHYSVLTHGGGGRPSRLLCGVVAFDAPAARELLRMLPAIIHIGVSSDLGPTSVHETIRLMSAELADLRPGGEAITTRLADIIVVQAIRSWLEHDPAARSGWLSRAPRPSHRTGPGRDPPRPWASLDPGDAGARSGHVAFHLRGPVHRARRPARHDLPHPLEDEHRPHPPERGRSQCEPGRRRPRLQL